MQCLHLKSDKLNIFILDPRTHRINVYMLDLLPYGVLTTLCSYNDLESAKSLRLVSKNLKWMVYDLVISE